MTRIKVGSSVRVRHPKPEWRDVHPNYTTKMDAYAGQVLTIANIVTTYRGEKMIYLEGASGVTSYQWRLEWLDTSINDTVQNGDLL